MTDTPYNLRRICLAGGKHPVAMADGQNHSGDDLREQALSLAGALAARPEQRWALWLTSPYEFLVAFLALSLAGKHIVLPGNMQQGTAQLLAPEFDGLISGEDFPELDCVRVAPGQPLSQPQDFTPCVEQDIAVTLFTSGSTGEPKAIAKRLSLLEAELGVQQQQWGAHLERTPVLSTVSHQHIYGLLHAVLWPFLRQAPFADDICQYPEELIARAEQHEQVVLVSSPTHLVRLPQAPVAQRGAACFAAVFSSGGLLEWAPALAVAELTGQTPVEILGSTETGGVAWRQQGHDSDNQTWAPLPTVKISRDATSDCLAVQAPHLGLEQPFIMGDKVAIHADGSFTLLGRADRLVKVEGKRLSVTEMERHLEACDLVAEARVAVVRARREEVGAAVVLSPTGREYLVRHGKLALNRLLKHTLLAYFERPLLPRRWRYIEAFPCNSQGKLVASALQQILQRET